MEGRNIEKLHWTFLQSHTVTNYSAYIITDSNSEFNRCILMHSPIKIIIIVLAIELSVGKVQKG